MRNKKEKSNLEIKVFHNDRDGEYFSMELYAYCKEVGIIKINKIPLYSTQIRLAERIEHL